MAKVGIDRETIESHIDQVMVGSGSGLNEQAVDYIKAVIAKALDENNQRLELDLIAAGIKLKAND
ncbi:MAG: hypothetical protein Q8Q00_08860 [Dehalococcoidia bacterium]|nr:hypothetical protein [Dehalococcoidia bacterium]